MTDRGYLRQAQRAAERAAENLPACVRCDRPADGVLTNLFGLEGPRWFCGNCRNSWPTDPETEAEEHEAIEQERRDAGFYEDGDSDRELRPATDRWWACPTWGCGSG